jgi:SMODS-associating 2TM, beta-strand rich effector domain
MGECIHMMDHEYALLGGISRTKVGRSLSLVAAGVSAGIVFILLSAVDIAKKYAIPAHVPPTVLSLVGAGAVFTALYWILDRYAWRWSLIGKLLNVPNISGEWDCEGHTINADGSPSYQWTAKITIVQTWDKIRVRLKTAQSGSNSNSAALICDEADGYRLFFSYKNDPRIDEPELKSHRGFAEIVFDKNLKKGDGEYFNGHGRFTFGTMKLKRS